MDRYVSVFFYKFRNWDKLLIFLVFIMMAFNIYCTSGSYTVRISSNYSIYDMNDMQTLQSKLTSEVNDDGIPIKDLEKFPNYYSYEFQFLVNHTSERSIGFVYKINSTGARSHYQDYSGEYKVDYLLEANSFGLIYEVQAESKQIQYPLGIKVMFITTDFLIKNSFKIEATGENEKAELKTLAESFGVEPYAAIQYNIKRFNFRANVSYLITDSVKLHAENDKDSILLGPDGEQVKVYWGSFNIGLSFGYNFR